MPKNIFKIFLVITIMTTLGLSIFNYYKYTQKKNFNILNDRQSMIIEIPNGQYIEIIGRNDSIYEKENTQNPFSTYSQIQKNTLLESTLNVNNSYIEEIFNDTNYRKIEIEPVSNNMLTVFVKTNTTHKYTPKLKYGIQIDYSGKTNFEDKPGQIEFEDNGCTVKITKVGGYEYIDYGNNQTLKIAQEYQPELEFKFNMYINCIE